MIVENKPTMVTLQEFALKHIVKALCLNAMLSRKEHSLSS